ncbi:MAG: hypothetical protein HONBIEJF_01526 [Fimbriimonadaceae bacterium]|nr:hypothetical protein [Fimbriimonadaceae bacterium]
METIEITAKSVDEAKQTAAQKLGVSTAEVEVVVLEETKGLFGKGSVRVKASTKPAEVEKPKRASRAKKAEPVAAVAEVAVPEPAVEPASADHDTETEIDGAVDVVATQQDADQLTALVNEVLDLAELQATVHPTGFNGKYVNLEIDGKDVAYLVGRQGEVLNAFQYLVNVMAAKQYGNGVRVVLDGGNYRKRREDALRRMASQIAEQVIKRQEEAVLDALPAFERRVVHQAIVEIAGVTTYSEGEEPNRRVVIAPGA